MRVLYFYRTGGYWFGRSQNSRGFSQMTDYQQKQIEQFEKETGLSHPNGDDDTSNTYYFMQRGDYLNAFSKWLLSRMETMEGALKFYADSNSWDASLPERLKSDDVSVNGSWITSGRRARKALSITKENTE